MAENISNLWGDRTESYRTQSEECLHYICECISIVNRSNQYLGSQKLFDMPLGCIVPYDVGASVRYFYKSSKDKFGLHIEISPTTDCGRRKEYLNDYYELKDDDVQFIIKRYGAQIENGYLVGFTFSKSPVIPVPIIPEGMKAAYNLSSELPKYILSYRGGQSVLELALKNSYGAFKIPVWRIEGLEFPMNDVERLSYNLKRLCFQCQ